jgi:ABC-type spermidine/putrescine transport system permease subunit II
MKALSKIYIFLIFLFLYAPIAVLSSSPSMTPPP